MRYLVTGLPRIRSAWLAALLGSNERPCYHDALVEFKNEAGLESYFGATDSAGWSDPTAACYFTDLSIRLYSHKPVVIVDRDEKSAMENFRSFMRLNGGDLTDWGWKYMVHNLARFRSSMPHAMAIDFAKLDDYETVARVYRHCVGAELSQERFNIFNLLNIEEMASKALGRF
jgi:hypothetical protein